MPAVQEPLKREMLLGWTPQKGEFAAFGILCHVGIQSASQHVLSWKAKLLLLGNPRQFSLMSGLKSFQFLLFHNWGTHHRSHRFSIYAHLGNFQGWALPWLTASSPSTSKESPISDISKSIVTSILHLTFPPPYSRPSAVPKQSTPKLSWLVNLSLVFTSPSHPPYCPDVSF